MSFRYITALGSLQTKTTVDFFVNFFEKATAVLFSVFMLETLSHASGQLAGSVPQMSYGAPDIENHISGTPLLQ